MSSNGEVLPAGDRSDAAPLHWTVATIDELTSRELHGLMKLRVDVFVVEQACAYPEVDELDALADTLHLFVRSGSDVIATARAMAPLSQSVAQSSAAAAQAATSDTTTSEVANPTGLPADRVARIGRVAVHPSFRGQGLARQMMIRLMQEIVKRFGPVDIVLGAQTVVMHLYRGLGFEVISEPYLEDGIEHVDMRYGAAEMAAASISD